MLIKQLKRNFSTSMSYVHGISAVPLIYDTVG